MLKLREVVAKLRFFGSKEPENRRNPSSVVTSREWASVCIVAALMLSLFAIRTIKDCALDAHYVKLKAETEASLIAIQITGEVQDPGIYYILPGTSVKKALENTKLLRTADRKRVQFKKILYHPQELFIPAKNKKKEGI